jgi:hypothetical protein
MWIRLMPIGKQVTGHRSLLRPAVLFDVRQILAVAANGKHIYRFSVDLLAEA